MRCFAWPRVRIVSLGDPASASSLVNLPAAAGTRSRQLPWRLVPSTRISSLPGMGSWPTCAHPVLPPCPPTHIPVFHLQLAEKRARDDAEAAEQSGKVELRVLLQPRVDNWMAGKKDNIRALLSTLHTVLWEDSGWVQPSMADMVDNSKVRSLRARRSPRAPALGAPRSHCR